MTLFEENAHVLRGMEGRGVDLSRARVIDFSHVFADALCATNFIEACKSAGYEAMDTTDEEMNHYDVTVSKEMIPTCENITATEEALGRMAKQYDGRSDGWGFYG
jgi:regulator of RNase E activity RraB